MFKSLSLHAQPILPAWLVGIVAAGLLGLLIYGCVLLVQKKVPPAWVSALGVLRVAIIVVFVFCLLQPVLSYKTTADQLPETLVLVDTSQSMGLPGGEGGKSRLDELVGALRGDLASSLEKQFRVHWFGFDRTAYPVDRDRLSGLKPTGDTTRYADSLTAAWSYLRPAGAAEAAGGAGGPGGTAPGRALLVSDGNDLGTESLIEAARRYGLAVDVLAPPAGGRVEAPELPTIADVQTSRRVRLGSETQFLVTLRRDGAPVSPVALTVAEGGRNILSQDVQFTAEENEKRVTVTYRPSTAGLKKYEFRVVPKSAGGGPAPAAVAVAPPATTAPAPPPGTYDLTVQVADDRNEVLVLEDTWRWDFKFLRRVLEDDPSFNFNGILSRPGGAVMRYEEPGANARLIGMPTSRAELAGLDIIVLGDVNPSRWSEGLARSLARLVIDEGKSLVVVAGPSLERLVESPALRALLPVELPRESSRPLEGPIEVRFSAEGALSPFFFNPPRAADGSLGLPAMDRIYPPLRKRPAATVLLEAAGQANAYGPLIVMAEHTVGRGRVLYVGTDTLWRWQTLGQENEAGVTLYALFWQQALRALAAPSTASSDNRIWLTPDRSRFEAGQRVGVTAEIKTTADPAQTRIEARVMQPDEVSIPLVFAADASTPGLYRAEFETAMPGQHKLTASIKVEGQSKADTATAIDVDPPKAELSGTRIDAAGLERIASATGGRLISLGDRGTWPTSDPKERPRVEETRSMDLWNNYALMLLLCGLLGVDWLLRLLRGYV